MAINKVIYNTENGAETLIDLTRDSVTPETLAEGVTAHEASGNVIAGAMPTSAVRYTAQTLTDGQKAQARENIGAVAKSGISLGVHSDGLVYVFVDGSPVGDGIELATAGDVIGYVDENNNVILTGALADGTYNIKYEMEDGSTVDIGDLVLDTNVYYSVTNALTNCVSNNSATEVIEGESYSATITANEGYELSSVVVTMGGTDISSTAVSGGTISIANVTGNIVITAVAEVAASEPVNQIPLSTDASGNLYNGGQGWKTGYRLSSSSGSESSQSGIEVTGFIPCKYTDTIYFKNITITSASKETYCFYDSSRTRIAGGTTGGTFGTSSGEVISKTISSINNTQLQDAKDKVAYIRISANAITANSIITVNQAIS